jgi:hypothetical protein
MCISFESHPSFLKTTQQVYSTHHESQSPSRHPHISHYLMAPETQRFALHAIQGQRSHFNPVKLLEICLEFNTKCFFVDAFERIVDNPFPCLTAEDAQRLGTNIFYGIFKMSNRCSRFG